MATWAQLRATANDTVDNLFGEAIQILPYLVGGYLANAQPDGTRDVKEGVGVPLTKEAMMKQAGGGSFMSRRLEADYLIEVQDKYIGDSRANDRVVFTASPDVFWEISYIEPSFDGYRCIHLMTIKDT